MDFLKEYGQLIRELYEISNPIIKYRIDKDLLRKENISIDQYISYYNDLINYWLNIFDKHQIHGRSDSCYENSIAKLLEFGFTKENKAFDEKFNFLLEDKYWEKDATFEEMLKKVVIYPFLIRAGYWNNKNLNNFFVNRLKKIEKTILKYGYDFKDTSIKRPKKYKDDLIFNIHSKSEALPTYYDLYAFAFYPDKNDNITRRIDPIVNYLLDSRFQSIPKKTYIYDDIKKRYYAAGNVYHACMTEKRKLLNIYLLSNFKSAIKSDYFTKELKKLLSYRSDDGFFEFDKSFIEEKKDSYFIYSGNHMGLGELRSNKNWRKIESTFWMLLILSNLYKNQYSFKSWPNTKDVLV